MGRLKPILYDLEMRCARRHIDPRRRALVSPCRGRVLELGVGTGLNLPSYVQGASVVGVDPDPAMLGRAAMRARTARVPVRLVVGAGEALPFRDATFDEVVAALVFCSVRAPETVLAEIRRVLRPGGYLRFYEHVRSPSTFWSRVQDWLTPVWSRVASG